jgi:RNase P subunit RPR2
METIKVKYCPKCNQILPVDNFNKRSKSKDKLQAMCKACKTKWSQEYYATHPERLEEVKKYRSEWYKKDRVERKEILRELRIIRTGSSFVL